MSDSFSMSFLQFQLLFINLSFFDCFLIFNVLFIINRRLTSVLFITFLKFKIYLFRSWSSSQKGCGGVGRGSLPSADSLPKWPYLPGLSQAEATSQQECPSGLPHEQELKHSDHPLLLFPGTLAGICIESRAAKTQAITSMRCHHCRWHFTLCATMLAPTLHFLNYHAHLQEIFPNLLQLLHTNLAHTKSLFYAIWS